MCVYACAGAFLHGSPAAVLGQLFTAIFGFAGAALLHSRKTSQLRNERGGAGVYFHIKLRAGPAAILVVQT